MPQTLDLRVGANGRMVLPRVLRQAMGLSGDTKVIATLEGDGVRLTPIHHGARRAQDLYRAHAKNPSSVDDFLEERREEAAREAGRADTSGRSQDKKG